MRMSERDDRRSRGGKWANLGRPPQHMKNENMPRTHAQLPNAQIDMKIYYCPKMDP